MIRRLLIMLLLSASAGASAQIKYEFREGKVTESELAMTSYPQDTTAGAVMIHEKYKVYFDYYKRFRQFREYSAKIKILDPSEVLRGVISVPYYSPEGSADREEVYSFKAACYNYENGKVVRSKVEPGQFFTEDLGDGLKVIYCVVPDVRPGSVIEYSWKIRTDNINIPPFFVQGDIPVVRSAVEVEVPDYMSYMAIHYNGAAAMTEKNRNLIHNLAEGTLTFSGSYRREFSDIPSYRIEPNLWCPDDMRMRVEFQVISEDDFKWVYDMYPKWEHIIDDLKPVLMPQMVELPRALKGITGSLPDKSFPQRSIRNVHRIITDLVKWNGSYAIRPELPDSVLAAGSGSSGDINYLLLSTLRSIGLDAEPVLLRLRSMGRMPVFPVEDDLSTFIVRVNIPGGNALYIDGTDPDSDINMFRDDLMVDTARRLITDENEGWVDIMGATLNTTHINVFGSVTSEGLLECNVIAKLHGATAYGEIVRYREQLFDGDYIRDMERLSEADVKDFSFRRDTSGVILEYALSKRLDGEEGIPFPLGLVPLIPSNPVSEGERIYPVEFPWPVDCSVNTTIVMPEGYQIAGNPLNRIFTIMEPGIVYTFLFREEGTLLRTSNTFRMGRIFYSPAENMELYNFFQAIRMLEKEEIIISLKPAG